MLRNRYQFVPPPPVVKRADLPRGEVLVQLCEEGLPDRNAWPDAPPKATESYREDAFGFFEVPHKYVDTGVRGDRANPYLFRAAAVVALPAGSGCGQPGAATGSAALAAMRGWWSGWLH